MDLKSSTSAPTDISGSDSALLSKPSTTYLQAESSSVQAHRRDSLSDIPKPLAAIGRISTSLVNVFHHNHGGAQSDSSPSSGSKPRTSPSFMSSLISNLTASTSDFINRSPLTPPRRKSAVDLRPTYMPVPQKAVAQVSAIRLFPLVQAAFQHIEEDGPQHSKQGIYRMAGNKFAISDLVVACQDNESKFIDDVILSIRAADKLNVACAVKQLYRENVRKIPVELVRSLAALFDDWSGDRAQPIKSKLDECPPIDRALWGILTQHLDRLSGQQPTTLMSANALAIVLAPNITAEPEFASNADQLRWSDTQRKAAERLITKASYFFPPEALSTVVCELVGILAPRAPLSCRAQELLDAIRRLEAAIRSQATNQYHESVRRVAAYSTLVCRQIVELDFSPEDGHMLNMLTRELVMTVEKMCDIVSIEAATASHCGQPETDALAELVLDAARIAKDIDQIGKTLTTARANPFSCHDKKSTRPQSPTYSRFKDISYWHLVSTIDQ